MQAALEEARARAAAEVAHERERAQGRIERLEQRLEEKAATITALRKAGAA